MLEVREEETGKVSVKAFISRDAANGVSAVRRQADLVGTHSSLEKVNPGIKPLFLSQKIDANEPVKDINYHHRKCLKPLTRKEDAFYSSKCN